MLKAEKKDNDFLSEMSKEKLIELLMMQVHNIWRVDGFYFMGIEDKFGTEAATDIDARCWSVMGKLEARELRENLGIKKGQMDIPSLLWLLRNTSWALYQVGKEVEFLEDGSGLFRVTRCRTQETRVQKGLGEFPCKNVRHGYLKSFVEELNPEIQVVSETCPPGSHPGNIWCEWKFSRKDKS